MTDGPRRTTHHEGLATGFAAVCFALAALAGLGFLLAYVLLDAGQSQTQWLGATLLVGLGGIGAGLVAWSRSAMPQGPHVEPREAPSGQPDEREAVVDAATEGAAGIGRRSLLGWLLSGAAGTVGLASLAPLASLGPAPRPEDVTTGWAAGRRLVREDGSPVARDDVPVGGAIPVFPEDAERLSDSQVMLIRLAEDGEVDVGAGNRSGTAAGHVAYSRLCSHMGCSVGLYQSETQSLVCPCHQSAFEVTDGARPEFGPATRPLPQLPITVDEEGFLVATAGFDRPVGAASWRYPAFVDEDVAGDNDEDVAGDNDEDVAGDHDEDVAGDSDEDVAEEDGT